LLDGQPVYIGEQRVEIVGVVGSVSSRAGRRAKTLDYFERIRSFEPLYYASERRGEPADVFVERNVLGPGDENPGSRKWI
jgi:hypothetical protein